MKIYWILPIILFFLQLIFTANSFNQIRYEELAESVRNVYWLQNRVIYDGVSSNVGWYGTLLVIYNIFGFALNTAKYVRLILQLISLIALAAILKKYLGVKYAWLPLLVIGLSPTLLFFNTLQTSFGLDLQYLPICLFLIAYLDFKKIYRSFLMQILLSFIAMIAWMSYPTFAYYLPSLAIFYLYQISILCKSWQQRTLNISLSIVAFFIPLFTVFAFIKNNQLLLYDEKLQSGIFRGAGLIILKPEIFWLNLNHTLDDLFGSANSYYFEVSLTDFSLLFPLIIVLVVLILTKMFCTKKNRLMFLIILIPLILDIISMSFNFDQTGLPGIRRNTPLLASIYALHTVTWYFLNVNLKNSPKLKHYLVIAYSLILVHHIIAYPINNAHLTTNSPFKYSLIFNLGENPQKSLDLLVDQISVQDLKLACKDQKGELTRCRYVEIYSAVLGSCLWNNFKCNSSLGYDDKTKKYLPLDISLWEKYYWEH